MKHSACDWFLYWYFIFLVAFNTTLTRWLFKNDTENPNLDWNRTNVAGKRNKIGKVSKILVKWLQWLSEQTYEAYGQRLLQKKTPQDTEGDSDFHFENKKHSSVLTFILHVKWSVLYTDQHSELIQTKMEPLPTKWIFTELPDLKGATFALFYLLININPPFKGK